MRVELPWEKRSSQFFNPIAPAIALFLRVHHRSTKEFIAELQNRFGDAAIVNIHDVFAGTQDG